MTKSPTISRQRPCGWHGQHAPNMKHSGPQRAPGLPPRKWVQVINPQLPDGSPTGTYTSLTGKRDPHQGAGGLGNDLDVGSWGSPGDCANPAGKGAALHGFPGPRVGACTGSRWVCSNSSGKKRCQGRSSSTIHGNGDSCGGQGAQVRDRARAGEARRMDMVIRVGHSSSYKSLLVPFDL